MARVVMTPEAARQLDDLDNPIHARVLKLLVRLQRWPAVSGAKPLRGEFTGQYRLRTGDYRLQFDVKDDVLTVWKIGHRDGFYEE